MIYTAMRPHPVPNITASQRRRKGGGSWQQAMDLLPPLGINARKLDVPDVRVYRIGRPTRTGGSWDILELEGTILAE